MNIGRKWYLFLGCLLVVVGVLALAGCSGSEGPVGPAGPAGPAGLAGPAGEAAAAAWFDIKLDPSEPGCGGVCHNELASHIQPNPEGKYTLAYEANHAWEGHGFDPLGKLLTLDDCLGCHAVGTGDRAGMGNVAPEALREIVHKVHLTSPHFQIELDEKERQGDCFVCHQVVGPSSTGLYE